MPKVTFAKGNTEFHTALKSRISEYFQNKKVNKTGNWGLYHKSVILLGLLLINYFVILFLPMPIWALMLVYAVFGLIQASIGFNVMHDACHGAYSENNHVNDTMGLTLNLLGGSSYFWKQKHNIIHHTYTNIEGVDDDIAQNPPVRLCHTQPWLPVYKFQHIYFPFIYCFTSIAWILGTDFKKYFKGKIHTTERWKMNTKEHIIFWFTKIYYIVVFLIIPILSVGVWPAIFGFLIMHVAMGFMLGIVFQLAHVVEATHFEEAHDDKVIDENWAIHQVKTTANFARKNKIINWYVGGLNFQVEHHLFPRISHIHYPAISEIVKKTCQDFGINYNDYPTMWSAVKSHARMIREFGRSPGLAVG